MSVTIMYRRQKFELKANITVGQALRELGLSPESHLAVRDGELLPESEVLRDGDIVRIVAVISGGGGF